MSLPHAIPLDGASNVRDLGGWPVAGGRHVRFGCVFRSASLAALTEQDAGRLAELGLRTVCDLRGEHEAARAPSRLDGLGVARHALPIEPKLGASLRDIEATREATGADALELMRMAYIAYALDWAPRYAQLFALAADPDNHGLLFHCAAGKDRTGFGAALLLTALGADRATVMEDYLATNRLWRGDPELAARLSPALADELLRVRPELLDAAFDAIRQRAGGIDAYLEQRLGLDATARDRLRSVLTE